MKKYLMSIVLLSVLNACGPSAADLARAEQAGKEEVLKQQEHAKEQEDLKDMLINLKSRLAGEETKLNSIEEFHLLRTSEKKSQQVTHQTKIIETIKAEITNVQNQIEN